MMVIVKNWLSLIQFNIIHIYITIGVIMRPSELFNSKLIPLLKDKGISNMENRKEWPLSILKEVLMILMNETPKNLLSKYVLYSYQ